MHNKVIATDCYVGWSIATVLQDQHLILKAGEAVGVFGEIKSLDYVLQQDDRLEIYAPLIQDPKHKRMAKVAHSTLPRRCR